MTDTPNIVELRPGDLNKATWDEVIPPDQILEANKNAGFEKLFLVGVKHDSGELVLAGSHSIFELYIHLGLAMREVEKRVT